MYRDCSNYTGHIFSFSFSTCSWRYFETNITRAFKPGRQKKKHQKAWYVICFVSGPLNDRTKGTKLVKKNRFLSNVYIRDSDSFYIDKYLGVETLFNTNEKKKIYKKF